MTELAQKERFRDGVMKVEERIKSMPGALGENPFPLKHSFGDGIYVREIRCPKNALIVTKIFKQAHATFLLSGECSIATEWGVERIKAPFSMITMAGTKRVVFCHTDVIWTTVHHSHDTDLERIEEEVIAKSFDELPISETEQKVIDLSVASTKGE